MKKILLLSSLILALYSPITYAADDQASVLVFDASGSMWGQLKDGRSKIEVAKEVIGEYLKGRDQSTPLGIIAYGHNRKGDCSDIEVLEPVGKKDHAQLLKKLNKINPKGKTPLTDALALALKQIPRTSEEADIILITDGLETCDRDPCALAQKIADEGIKIRAHVVGFGLTEKEVNSLSCIPEKTGGQLLRPQSGKELSEALQKVESQPTEPVVTAPSIVSTRIIMSYVKGSIHPSSVKYSAINKQTNETVDLGETNDTLAILQGQTIELLEGRWLLKAEGPLGEGELEVTIKEGERYVIPYVAKKPTFSIKDLGPYELGIKHTFFLNLSLPMQKGKQMQAMLFTTGDDKANNQRIDHEYLIGEDKGIKTITFISPKEAGKYQIIIGQSFKDKIVSFGVEYVNGVQLKLIVPKVVKPKEKFAYALYGNTNRYNQLVISQDGKTISDVWMYNTSSEDGLFLTAPEKVGTYTISLIYKNSEGENLTDELAQIQVREEGFTELAKVSASDKVNQKPVEKEVTKDEVIIDKTKRPEQKTNSVTDNSHVMMPVNTFDGKWTLTKVDIDDRHYSQEILSSTLQGSPEGPGAVGKIVLIGTDILGEAGKSDQLKISPKDEVGQNGQPTVEIQFSTIKGNYSAQLSYYPVDFDQRIESWAGQLKLNGKDVAFVFFENTTVTENYHQQASKKKSKEVAKTKKKLVENKNKIQENTSIYKNLEGRWILNAKSNELIRVTVQDKKGDRSAGAYFSVYEDSEALLGKAMHEDGVKLQQKDGILSLEFKTRKTVSQKTTYNKYTVTLDQQNVVFFKNTWKGVEPSFEQTVWSGYLQKNGEGEKTPVYLEKMFSDKATITKTTDIFLYDTNTLDKLGLVFTCEKASCTYDDDKTKLIGIPLLKDWAIQTPYYYSTAGGGVSTIPTILFIHTKTGLWFVLNQRQANTEMFNCIEFGKNGRLSDEEQHCSPKNIPDHLLMNGSQFGTMMESIEFWRAGSYLNESNDLTEEEKQKLLLFSDGEVVE